MSPQIYNDKTYNYKADTWSLGIVLFELLNGKTPFHAPNRKEFEKKFKTGKYQL